ncbi:hypothetical protein AVEN_174963-1 [Araneus ventricosus]|uniref:Integrase catalytic domain-containing protein n=1 Tax=Araneus ventricosus TaxID=182803 RepID=A0A4Y2TUD1_ARAVE|nr:hypothetical protein AVEN_174963-1 [Araneus ventricosus]
MTFGLRNAAQTMQKYIDSIIRNIPSCYAYVDYLIASTDQESHMNDLDLVFNKLSEHGIVELRRFLTTLNFSHRFLKDVAKEQACLHCVVKNKVKKDNTPIAWTEDTQSVFKSGKRLIANATALSFPAANSHLSLMTDASDFAVGAVLQQHFESIVEPLDSRDGPESFPIPPILDQSADTIARAYLLGWISRFGVPEKVTSDHGTNFQSNLFSSLSKFLGAEQTMTTAYHPQSNGAMERFHRHLKSALMTHLPENWLDALPLVLFGIRTNFKQDLVASSAGLVYGTTLKLPGEIFLISR